MTDYYLSSCNAVSLVVITVFVFAALAIAAVLSYILLGVYREGRRGDE